MPESVVITGSKVVFSAPETGVTVVCNLSDGTAYSVRLAGENKDVSACLYFPMVTTEVWIKSRRQKMELDRKSFLNTRSHPETPFAMSISTMA